MKNQEKIYSDVLIRVEASNERRNPAFASFNRVVNLKHVDRILEKMMIKGYRVGEPIHVTKAENAPSFGITELIGLNGKKITKDEFHNFWLVLEGQHRTYAVSKYNDWLTEQSRDTIDIPAKEAEFINGESITEFINEINVTKNEWSKEDYLNGSANIRTDEPLLQIYKELIKNEANPRGYSLSTLNLIYCNSGGLTKNDLVLICSGAKKKGIKVKIDIIPGYDLETGNQFIEICKKVGFRDSEITKRYLIKEFNKIRNSSGGKEFALKVFQSITSDDISLMTNKHDNLVEQEVINHFENIKSRLQASTNQQE